MVNITKIIIVKGISKQSEEGAALNGANSDLVAVIETGDMNMLIRMYLQQVILSSITKYFRYSVWKRNNPQSEIIVQRWY